MSVGKRPGGRDVPAMTLGPLSALESENGVAPRENNIPTITSKTTFDEININESENIHFGPKFINSTVNYIDKTKRKSIRHFLMIFIVVGVFIIIIITLSIRGQKTNDPEQPTVTTDPTTDSTPYPTMTPTQTVTPGTTNGTSPRPHPTPPEDWLVPYSTWSIGPHLQCNPILNNSPWTVSVDRGVSCETMEALRSLQDEVGLRHNFYISQSGTVYEAHGWSCASEYDTRFSRTNIVIAICGDFNEAQEIIFEKLVQTGKTKPLRTNFNLIPECCRGIPGRRGPGKKINKYLILNHGTSRDLIFKNAECVTDPWCD